LCSHFLLDLIHMWSFRVFETGIFVNLSYWMRLPSSAMQGNPFQMTSKANFRNPLIRAISEMEGYRLVPSTYSSSALTWSVKDPMPLLSVVTDAHPGKSLTRKRRKQSRLRTASIQSGFVTAKGSVPVKSRKKSGKP